MYSVENAVEAVEWEVEVASSAVAPAGHGPGKHRHCTSAPPCTGVSGGRSPLRAKMIERPPRYAGAQAGDVIKVPASGSSLGTQT